MSVHIILLSVEKTILLQSEVSLVTVTFSVVSFSCLGLVGVLGFDVHCMS